MWRRFCYVEIGVQEFIHISPDHNHLHIHKLGGNFLFKGPSSDQSASVLFNAGHMIFKEQSLESTRPGNGRSKARKEERASGVGVSEMSINFTEGLAQ